MASVASLHGERLSRFGTVRTSDALGSLFPLLVVRESPRRESYLSAVCGDAAGGRHGAVIRTAAVSATSRMSWSRPVAGARSRAEGAATEAGSLRVEPFAEEARRAESVSWHGTRGDAKTPNQAMQLTASKPADLRFQGLPSCVYSAVHAQRARGS